MKKFIVCPIVLLVSGVSDGATTPAWVLNEARQHAEVHKLKTMGSSALSDPFWTYVRYRHDLNPVRFDRYHPVVGRLLERFEAHPVSTPTPVISGTFDPPVSGDSSILVGLAGSIATPPVSGLPPGDDHHPSGGVVPCPSSLSMAVVAAVFGVILPFRRMIDE